MKFCIGHGAYTGRNALHVAESHAAALRELLTRGVRMSDAQRALRAAKGGSHATCSYKSRMPSGALVAVESIEVVVLWGQQ